MSQSNQIVSGTEAGLSKSYTYDKAVRLTAATIGTNSYAYSYAAPTTCTGTYNANAAKSSNITSKTINSTTTTFCYDYADRLVSSSDATLTTPTYDGHGNTTRLGTAFNADGVKFAYDSSDRNTRIQENSGSDYDIRIARDATDRILSHYASGLTNSNTWYSYTGSSSAPTMLFDASANLLERYMQLAGGVLLTIRSGSTRVYSLSNIHGDTLATTNQNGSSPSYFTYEPYGKLVGSTAPNNVNAGTATFGPVGKFEKLTDYKVKGQPTQMGARAYMAVLGRFMSVDPIDGGNANNYTFPANPITGFDLSGLFNATCYLFANCGSQALLQPAGQVQHTASSSVVQPTRASSGVQSTRSTDNQYATRAGVAHVNPSSIQNTTSVSNTAAVSTVGPSGFSQAKGIGGAIAGGCAYSAGITAAAAGTVTLASGGGLALPSGGVVLASCISGAAGGLITHLLDVNDGGSWLGDVQEGLYDALY
jgi:RHS repeat-associated protein